LAHIRANVPVSIIAPYSPKMEVFGLQNFQAKIRNIQRFDI